MDNSKPISIQNVQGNVTVTIVEGINNQTQVSVNDFIEKTNIECGLRLIYEDNFKQNSNTKSNFNEWLKGFSFDLKSVYHKREYRREKVIDIINEKLEDKKRLLILGESGTSKTILLMEVLCDYLKKGYKILHNLDPTSASGAITNLEYLENTLSLLVQNGNNVIVIVDNVHNKTISNIFSLIQKIKNDHEDKLDKIRFLLSARQPEFKWAMDRGIFDSQIIERIDILFDDTRKYNIPYFTEDEIKGFIEKYKEYIHPSKRNKTIEENAHEIFKDTEGHPIMVRFSVLQDGLRTHVKRMYTDYLLQNNSPNIERIKSVIACSIYDISSIPLKDESLRIDLDLENASLEIVDTIIKNNENSWTTIHPRWDLELFKYMFSLNEADRAKIKKAFSFILNKILDIYSGSFKQLDFLRTVYITIVVGQFIDIKIIQEMIKVDDIEKKLDSPYFKLFFFANYIGVAFLVLGRNEEAIDCFDKAIEIDPQNAWAYSLKGRTLSVLGRNKEAIECCDKAIEIDPQYTRAYDYKGIALSALGRNEEAIECYNKAIEINPQYVGAYINKGNALSALGRYEEAIASYDKALEIDPQYTDAYVGKGTVLSDLGKNEEAIECYNKTIEIDPQYTDAYVRKGTVLSALGRYEEAIDCFDKAIEIDPQNAWAYSLKGNALSALGRNEEAIASYDKAIEIDPQYVGAYYNKGSALSNLGKNEEAIVCYDKAIEINPQSADAYYNKGVALSDRGKNEEAIASYDKALEIDPQYTDAYVGKGTVLSTLGRNEEAIASYDKAIEINPQSADAYYNKGSVLSDLGKNEEAIASYDKALAIDPNFSYAINNKAFALAKLDKNEEALPIIERGLEIAPNTDYVLATAAFIMYNLGKYSEAKNYYNKALDINPNLKDTLSEPELKVFNDVMK